MAYTVYRVQLYMRHGAHQLQFLAIQAFLISASVMYMDVCMQHGGIYVHGNI